ncbi:nitrate- and nitrite sensing domain-containing protein [Actinokineospora sp.]|uniref:nitrate- and nitrite sensing domain-containing protein n=1 Tax=Actinokineospora sp. TaxID=1872133 RepID=UPI004037EE66
MPGHERKFSREVPGEREEGERADDDSGLVDWTDDDEPYRSRSARSDTDRPRRTARSDSPWRPSNWRLRTKMTVVLLVPAIAAVVFGGLRVKSEIDNADNFRRIVDQVDVALQITEVVHQLQSERALVVARVAAGDGALDTRPQVTAQYRETDDAIFTLRNSLSGLDIPDAEGRDRYDLSFNQLKQLTALRNLAQGAIYPDLAVLTNYNSVIDPLVQLGREVATVGDSSPSRVSSAVQTLGQAKERGAQLDALLLIAAVRNNFGADSVQNRARSIDAGFDAAIADFASVATPDERQSYSDGYSGPEVDRRRGIVQTALISPDPLAALDIDVAVLNDTSVAANDKLRAVERKLIAGLRAQASASADAATAAALRDAAIVVAMLVIALGMMLVVAWSLLAPLRRLRQEALEVAKTRLPETLKRILADPNPVEAAKKAVAPVPVFSNEEIGQVARSFDAVHEQAVRMATEQAVLRDNVNTMFVNLSRRSQALIERQLAELDQLEQNEQDPDQLSRFFVLDHLAARMRRNSESLLILSGSGLAKRMARPVSVSEVVESALSEIEHYTRVQLRPMPDLLVQGRVVKDLVHLIAELLDNAATFSAPGTAVMVASARVRSGELAIQISDEGLGMTDEELAEANEKLANPPDFDVSLSRRMGLYVVARLAQRHAIRVRLHGDIDAGTTAVVTLPAELMAASNATDPRTDPLVHTGPQTIPPARAAAPRTAYPKADSQTVRVAPVERSMPAMAAVTDPPAHSEPRHSQPVRRTERPAPRDRNRDGRRSDSTAVSSTSAGALTGHLSIPEKGSSQWFPSGPPDPTTSAALGERTSTGSMRPPRPSWSRQAEPSLPDVQSILDSPPAAPVGASGLPKRAPRERLIPGSAPVQRDPQDTGSTPLLPQRSPELIRARLSRFQQGLHRARSGEPEAGAEPRGEWGDG